ncbi:MAG TPA: hypothetical protein PLB79_08810 [Thermotogota bacterium]|jgi:hypothetical protein|nr:MAG: hypothetical protein BWX67_00937 [Thermotogota bacterium ADurb.Bin062]HNW46126.1 hypothetical protein [Thermotogota bacterium]HNY82851.1 hypothetical protein [Thermotogota bacterium]HOD91058.1 hypothetical protein [Thermotogota bacterium]HOF23592.1 hypothetical protein [Thermotogota bacterium]
MKRLLRKATPSILYQERAYRVERVFLPYVDEQNWRNGTFIR